MFYNYRKHISLRMSLSAGYKVSAALRKGLFWLIYSLFTKLKQVIEKTKFFTFFVWRNNAKPYQECRLVRYFTLMAAYNFEQMYLSLKCSRMVIW